jgi:hypothetical protein
MSAGTAADASLAARLHSESDLTIVVRYQFSARTATATSSKGGNEPRTLSKVSFPPHLRGDANGGSGCS